MITVGFVALLIATLAFWQHGMKATFRKKNENSQRVRRWKRNTILAVLGWLGYITLLSTSNILADMESPLRIPILVLLPVTGFLTYFFLSNKFKVFVMYFPKPMTVYGQTLRIAVELLIYGSYVQGVIPAHATFEGYNLSILIGITAPVVGCMAYISKTMSTQTLVGWNLLGLGLLAVETFVFMTTLICPELCGIEHTFAPQFGSMPYLLLLSVFIPSAAFMHMVSIAQTVIPARRKIQRQYA